MTRNDLNDEERRSGQSVRRWITADGGMDAVDPFVSWTPEHATATLDGDFTPGELRAIADQMERAAKVVTEDGRR